MLRNIKLSDLRRLSDSSLPDAARTSAKKQATRSVS